MSINNGESGSGTPDSQSENQELSKDTTAAKAKFCAAVGGALLMSSISCQSLAAEIQVAGGDHIKTDASHENQGELDFSRSVVHLLGGGTITLVKVGNSYGTLEDGTSKNGTDNLFAGIFQKDGKLYIVSDNHGLEIKEFQTTMGIDYLKEFPKMAESFAGGELEYQVNNAQTLEKLSVKKRIKMIGVFTRLWKQRLNEIYNYNGIGLEKTTVDMFQEKTPNMVLGWKGLGGGYDLVYTGYILEKNIAEGKKNIAEMRAILQKLGKN